MEQDQPYLTTKDLAERYGITQRTIKKWRTSTRRGKAEGPLLKYLYLINNKSF